MAMSDRMAQKHMASEEEEGDGLDEYQRKLEKPHST
jgi:hypothetical protein